MPRFARAVLGGTFDHLHLGHEALLASAFRWGRTVAIGVTTEAYLRAHPKPDRGRIQPFATRHAAVTRWVKRTFPGRAFEVRPLEDPFGGSVAPGVSVLIVSSDTRQGGRAVNRERQRRGLAPVPVVVVPLALADDLEPVSSRRIRSGEIDRSGRRRSSIPVVLSVADRRDLPWVRGGVRSVFPRARVSYRSPGPRARARATAVRPPRGGLAVSVTRRPGGGWTVREASDRVRLPTRVLDDASPSRLREGLAEMLRPRHRSA